MFSRIYKIYNQWRLRIAIKRIREHLIFFGCNIESLTDEELLEKILEYSVLFNNLVSKCGMTCEELSKRLAQLGHCMKDSIGGERDEQR